MKRSDLFSLTASVLECLKAFLELLHSWKKTKSRKLKGKQD